LLIVDEAHTLPLRVLEEIRMLTNLVRDGQSRVRVVLAGAAILEERFASPKLASFAQRLAARCYLEPLGAQETGAYVRAQLEAVGGDPDQLVDEPAFGGIYRASDGIPRLINQLCDHALILASLGGAARLTSHAIEEAWADLQQLPTPFQRSEADATSSVVEFGHLDEAAHDPPQAIPFHAPAGTSRRDAASDAAQRAAVGGEPQSRIADFGGTEVDLDFPEFADTFGEQFEEEEVVLDRYASDVEIFADVPRVSSWEGRQLGSLLEPLNLSSSPESPETATLQFGALGAPDEPAAANVVALDSPEAPQIVCAPAAGFSLATVSSAGPRPTPITDASSAFWAGAEQSSRERELIVVEDDAAAPLPQPPQKREYRQLFAKLRRG
jgi:hypothetical protein